MLKRKLFSVRFLSRRKKTKKEEKKQKKEKERPKKEKVI
jgi:hypothetical protein